LAQLGTSEEGLAPAEASARLARQGPNALPAPPGRSVVRMLASQFTDVMILVLLGAAGVSLAIGDATDAVAILAIVVLNAVIGVVQEYRAERALQALQAMAAPTAVVRRGGAVDTVPADGLVPGDVVLIEAGTIVPADLRLIDAARVRIDESALTGESAPVEKTIDPLVAPVSHVSDRRNMAHKGTVVTYGRGVGVTVATGPDTEFGRIAALLDGDVTRTPLQRRLADFGRRLAIVVLAICAVVFTAGLLRGEPPLLMFLTALSLAVAAIPEALPAVVTIALALGARRMVQRQALVRRLPAVETLGSVTHICSDKTGTLTYNRMRTERWWCDGVDTGTPGGHGPWERLLLGCILNSDARPQADGTLGGDPTEVALRAGAEAAGLDAGALLSRHPRIAELPFDAERKCMTTVHRDGDRVSAWTKGAAEAVLAQCTREARADGVHPLDLESALSAADRLAADGLRVLAVAERSWDSLPETLSRETLSPDAVERDLTLLGLVGLIDPPREAAADAVATCREAGIVPVMITGDHPLTARAIAARVGIAAAEAPVLTGEEVDALSDEALGERLTRVRVFARVAPAQKLRLVAALQARGACVAMTGDGVNDAPALRRADIGIAMGITGTDVAKEASAMILLDDNFATIVGAVREGRRIYDNVRKFIRYTMTSNAGEIWAIFLAPLVGLPIPLLPVHILWINLVTDGLPGLALAGEPAEPDIMQRRPRPPDESVFAGGMALQIAWVGLLLGGLVLAVQAWATARGLAHWQTMAFTVLCLSQLGNVMAMRSERQSLLRIGLFSNPWLLLAVAVTFLLQMATIYVPALNPIFRTEPLTAGELLVTLVVSSGALMAVEAAKWMRRARES
ncbi:MAG: cation-translocating P-type ATPase, partial [Acidobacteria bacterium]|nr:cation-translocating P-type ATPase [Acidobacteriota bacterium]